MAGCNMFFFCIALIIILHFNLNTAQTYIQDFCFEEYTANSTYETNLNHLLSSISNNTIGNNTRFYTNTVGKSPDIIYGIFQCRGDAPTDVCRKCAQTASTDIKFRCPFKKEITIWYDECWMRYSNKIIISTMIGDPKKYFSFGKNVTNPILYRNRLNGLMEGLAARAINSTDMFATGEEIVTDTQTIYGLVQCSQDISRRDCGRCLARAIIQIAPCCDAQDSGRILKPSCILWFEVYKFFENSTLPVLVSPSTPSNSAVGQGNSSRTIIIIVVSSVTGVVLLSVVIIFLCLRKKRGFEKVDHADEVPTVESLQFMFGTIVAATDNFNDANKLGEGGFGAVYRGRLSDRSEIAVKRLSRNSGQGEEEFKNEVVLLAKLQHRNLVRLLGFCLEGNEKLLVYEYVPNASLDKFLFDMVRCTYLNWKIRYNIIKGIARGLLYLHEDSQDRIIHRDLKASNILLDANMVPKISDFGLAKLFLVDQTMGNTNKIVGTFGYMSPEYLLHGQFSVKSDVFSFGILVLEIITGQKTNSFRHAEHAPDLLSYVWKHWEDGTALELLDPTLREHHTRNEVVKSIQIGLLCIQEDPPSRPTMASIVLMLNSDSVTLPLPSAPAFFVNSTKGFSAIELDYGTKSTTLNQSLSGSIDEASITDLHPR